MTALLPAPVFVDNPEDWGPDLKRCGQENANALVSIVLPNSTFGVPDGADAGDMQNAIGANCPGAQIMTLNDNAADLVTQYLSRGWYILAQVYCTGQANPVPPAQATADHWITIYGDDPNALPWAQVWTNSLLTMTLGYLRSVSHAGDAHFHLLVKLPGIAPTATTTADTEDDDMAFTLSWDWPEKLNGTQRQRMVTCTGDGQLWERFYDDDPANLANAGWKRAVMPQADGKNLPGTLTKMRSGTQWHIFNIRSDGTTGHWFQGDGDPSWGYDTCDGTTDIVPSMFDALVALIRSLPPATGGWTTAQQQEVDSIRAAIDRIEAGLKAA